MESETAEGLLAVKKEMAKWAQNSPRTHHGGEHAQAESVLGVSVLCPFGQF